MSSRKRRISTLAKWMRDALPGDGSDAKLTEKVSKYVGPTGSQVEIDTWISSLPSTDGFERDGLILRSTDVIDDPMLIDVLDKIVTSYETKIIPPFEVTYA